MSKHQQHPLDLPYALKSHRAVNLQVESQALAGNPLGDPTLRHNYVLEPLQGEGPFPVVFHLSGYFSTGYHNFQAKTLNTNFVQDIDVQVALKKAPRCLHIFVEADTYWGGSQFINSAGSGAYADYILRDLVPAVQSEFPVSTKQSQWCVMGGSSGGYGSLSLISEKRSPFGLAFATAPDSFFEASLLPELFKAAPEIAKYKNFSQIKKKLAVKEMQDKKSFFNFINIVAMAHCYAPASSLKKDWMDWPIDLYTGRVNQALWKKWLKKDPIHFLKGRSEQLAGKEIFLDVGTYDNFSLQLGTRQIAELLKSQGVRQHFNEFPGGHFGLRARRLLFLERLCKKWKRFV